MSDRCLPLGFSHFVFGAEVSDSRVPVVAGLAGT